MPAWLPSAGLLRTHHDYGIWATDAPPIYHVASMLSALASVVADTAKLVVENHPYPLHVWSMLIGKSTTDRKTTATRLAINRVERAVNNANRIQRIYGSPEGILQGMTLNPCICLYVPEGGAFFAQREASYWRHARDIFMDLYDYTEKFERKLVKDTFTINNPRISILAACALPLLERYTHDTDWLGGFLARFLMVAGEPLPFKNRPQSDKTVEQQIEALIYNCYTKNWGTLGCTTGARRVLDDFSAEIHANVSDFHPGLAPSLNRLPETANRLAALYEIASLAPNPPPDPKITLVTADSAACAVALCRDSRDHALAQLGELTTAPGVGREIARIEGMIRQAGLGGISRSQIMRTARMKAGDLDKLLHTLSEMELVGFSVGRTGGRTVQRFVHVEAQADATRIATAVAHHPSLPIAYINFNDGTVNIDALPVHRPPHPGVSVCNDHDETDDLDVAGKN